MYETERLRGARFDLVSRSGGVWLLVAHILVPAGLVLLPPGGEATATGPEVILVASGIMAAIAAVPLVMRFVLQGTRMHLLLGLGLLGSGAADIIGALPTLIGQPVASQIILPGRFILALVALFVPLIEGRWRYAERPWWELGFGLGLVLATACVSVFLLRFWPESVAWTVQPSLPVPRPFALVALSLLTIAMWTIWRIYLEVRSRLYAWLALGCSAQLAGTILWGFTVDDQSGLAMVVRLMMLVATVEFLVGQALYQVDLLHDRQIAISDLKRSIVERDQNLLQLRRYADDLERSREDIESYTYAASHDLQEPLRSVQFFCARLQERYAERLDQKGRQYIAYAVDGSERMSELIQAILDYSRVQRQGLKFRRINVGESLDLAQANLESAIERSGLRVHRDELPEVTVDRTQLARLFQNLLANAMKYNNSSHPTVTVGSERRRREWVISVSDNGIGIDPQYHERIFGVFKRLHKRDVYPGSGVGLSICQRIAERRGGRIWVESALGQGATFRFTIPDEVPYDITGRLADESDL